MSRILSFAAVPLLVLGVTLAHGQEPDDVPDQPLGLSEALRTEAADDPISRAENNLRVVIERFLGDAQDHTLAAFQQAVDTYSDAQVPVPPLDTTVARHVAIEQRLGQLSFMSEALRVVAGHNDAANVYRTSVHSAQMAEIVRQHDKLSQARKAEMILVGSTKGRLVSVLPEVPTLLGTDAGLVPFLVAAAESPVQIDSVELLGAGVESGAFFLDEDQCSEFVADNPLPQGGSCFFQVAWNLGADSTQYDLGAILVVKVRSFPDHVPQSFYRQLAFGEEFVSDFIQERTIVPVAHGLPSEVEARLASIQQSVNALQSEPSDSDAGREGSDLDRSDQMQIYPVRLRLLSLSSMRPREDGEISLSAFLAVCPPPSASGESPPCTNPSTFFLKPGDPIEAGWFLADVDIGAKEVTLVHNLYSDFVLRTSSRRVERPAAQPSATRNTGHSHGSATGVNVHSLELIPADPFGPGAPPHPRARL